MTRPHDILVTLGCFSPGLEANGPNQTLLHMAAALGDAYRFKVLAMAAPGERTGQWRDFLGLPRFALAPGRPFARNLLPMIRSTPHDLLLGNGFFDRALTLPILLARRFGRLPRTPFLLSPRGEFNPGALAISAQRKRAYLAVARNLDLTQGVALQASDAREAATIADCLPGANILLGPNLRQTVPLQPFVPRRPGAPLRLVYLARIDRVKNLHLAIEWLIASGVAADFDIIGPVQQAAYGAQCRALAARAGRQLQIRWLPPILPQQLGEAFAGYDLAILPTAGENFGHGILDSLMAGTPILVADTTPWRGLAAAHAGADLPLDQPEAWRDWLNRFAAMSPDELLAWRQGARHFGEAATADPVRRQTLEATLAAVMANA